MTVMDTNRMHESERQAREWLLHLTSGRATREDGEAFRRWCLENEQHAAAFARTRRMWEELGPAVTSHRKNLGRSDRPTSRHAVRMTRRRFVLTAISASVAAVVVARFGGDLLVPVADASTLRTAVGEQRRVEVTRGVVVEMNTSTDIALRRSGDAVTGMRLRRGEAVVHIDPLVGQPFVVELADARLSSSPGTAFAVRCDDDAGSVTCLDGRTVLSRGSANTLVKPSQQVDFSEEGVSPAVAVNPDHALAWRRRVLIYDNLPLSDVVADINRYRPGRIVITDAALGARRVHARFTLDQMADVPTLIQDAYGAHATHLPGGWVLLS
ncbi:ferric-dicitrate binding protein FerR (iron transport regulator) [Luteibacter sp. 1214]|nr:ferric-dicitrate binding protein FerR (iron transport regulator) [Luteibacter sp. 1214]